MQNKNKTQATVQKKTAQIDNRPNFKKKRFWVKWFFIFIGVYISINNFYIKPSKQEAQEEFTQKIDQEKFSKKMNHDKYWFVNTDSNFSTILEEKTDEIKKLIQEYKNFSSLSKDIHTNYTHIASSLYTQYAGQAVSMIVSKDSNITAHQVIDLEICFIKKSDLVNQINSVWYNQPWNAIMIPGTTFSPIFYKALVMHEIGHALYSKKEEESSKAEQGSDAYIREEIQMHEFESEILNKETKGKYFLIIDSIIKSKSTPLVEKFVASLEKDDFKRLHALILEKDAGETEEQLFSAQNYTTLCNRFIDQSYVYIFKQDKKIDAYRFITGIEEQKK